MWFYRLERTFTCWQELPEERRASLWQRLRPRWYFLSHLSLCSYCILWSALLINFEIVPKKHRTDVWNVLTNKQCISHFWPCQIYLFVNQQPFSFTNDSLQSVDCINDSLFLFSFYVDTDTRARKIFGPTHFHLIWIWIIENCIRASRKLHPSALSFADFPISLPRYTIDARF